MGRRKKEIEKQKRRKEKDEKIKKKLRSKKNIHAMAQKNTRKAEKPRAGPNPTKREPTKISKKQVKTKGEPGNTKTKSLKMIRAAKKEAEEQKQNEKFRKRRNQK